MKVFSYIVVGLLTVTACLAVIVALRPPEQSGFPVKYIVLAGLLLGWAILLAYYQLKSYRGGAASIIGAIVLGIAIQAGLGGLLWEEHTNLKEAWLYALVTLLFIGMGAALMLQGHRKHKLRANHVQDT